MTRTGRMMCICVSVVSLNSGRSLGETDIRMWWNVQYQYTQIWYQCKIGRSWGYVAGGHHKTKKDSRQQELSRSDILIHTTRLNIDTTEICCILEQYWVNPESAQSFLSAEAPGGTHPTSHWRCGTTQILHRHVHWAGCIPGITYCRVPDDRLSGCARHSEDSTFLRDKPTSTHSGIKRKG